MAKLLPAEWEPQAAILLSWPHKDSDWADILDQVEPDFIALAKAILNYQKLIVVCADELTRDRLSVLLSGASYQPIFLVYSCNDTWIRDYGPITVLENGHASLNDFGFNGWGGKFQANRDDACSLHLHEKILANNKLTTHAQFLEGGAIDSNGQGVLLTTSTCLLTDTRNPGFSKFDWVKLFAEEMGIHTTLWLDSGYLEGDDTDSHVDTLARFIAPDHIVYVKCDDPQDPHYRALLDMERQLQQQCDYHQLDIKLTPLPWPAACFEPDDGHRLPATYANFLFLDGAVLVPTYNDAIADEKALTLFKSLLPDYDIIPIASNNFIRQHGSVHCLTMQLPAETRVTI